MSVSTSATESVRQAPSRWLPRFLQPAPPAAPVSTDPQEIRRLYAHHRLRVLIWATAGYAVFYFVRKNLSVAMPAMEHDLGISKASLGLFLTMHGVLYGVSKFANGFLGDRANARIFMALGLLTSAGMNLCFGFSTAATALGLFWMINGWFQGMGFPPCARLLTHWFSPKELATKMAMWNTSHTIGAAVVLVMCGYLVQVSWRLCFIVPAGLAALMGCLLLMFLRDTPESVGLPEVEGTAARKRPVIEREDNADGVLDYASRPGDEADFKSVLARKVFGNPYIWVFSLANAFVYTIRYGVLDWGPTLLKEAKGIDVSHGSWMVAAFESAGLVGILLTGWLTDRFFAGRASRMCVICMVMCGAALVLFWKAPAGDVWLNTGLMMVAGFFIYGPQALIGVAAANLATKRAAATAVGLTGFFGYASTVLSGWGLGLVAEHYGWDACFQGLIAIAALGTVLFIAAWGAKAHGYEEEAGR